jgi:hypothetical protein
MLPGVQKFAEDHGMDVHDPEVPLVAIMFRTEREFREHSKLPRGVVAYYNILTNRIVMCEESPLWRIRRDLAIQRAISTIAHEGAHQILHNIGVQQRLSTWPTWLAEGLAEYLAPTTFGKDLRWKGAGEVNDMRMFNLDLYLKSREADTPDGQMVEHTIGAAQLTSTGYAAAWSLTHYLAESRRPAFQRYLQEVSQTGPFEMTGKIVAPGVVPENLAVFRKHFSADLAEVQSSVIEHLKGLPYRDPFADWPHWAALIRTGGGKRDANLFHSRALAEKWIRETLALATAEERARANSEVRGFRNRLSAERYAREFLGP